MSGTASAGGRELRATGAVVLVALAVRAAFVAWAAARIAPTADGQYYQVIAERIAAGHGYTWLWPDGAVTYAAHYPVGYPALVAIPYRLFGPAPVLAMALNAALGGAAAGLLHRALLIVARPRAALLAGLAFALHPALVSYTPALMTEGVTASLLCFSLLAALRAREASGVRALGWLAALGVLSGVGTLVRPQVIVFAPLFAACVVRWNPRPRQLARIAGCLALALAAALVVVSPWTARNCARMGRCALVSVNAGWNLLIGTDPSANGSWAPLETPAGCRDVFDEAGKDACFEREARRIIREDPAGWLSLAPRKLAATFDYFGAGPWYLHAANPGAFGERAKWFWGGLETVFQRLLLGAALFSAARALALRRWSPRPRVALGVALACAATALLPGAWIAVVFFGLLAAAAAVLGPLPAAPASALPGGARSALGLASVVVLGTAFVHATFFGAGRYGLVIIPALVLAAACGWPRSGSGGASAQPG